MSLYLGPWMRGDEGWTGPEGTLASLDFGSPAQCAELSDSQARGLGLFLLRPGTDPGSDYSAIAGGSVEDAVPGEQARGVWESRLRVRPLGMRLAEWIFETFQAGDPAGLDRVVPICPGPRGFELWFANRRVLTVAWRWGDAGTALVRELLRRRLVRYRDLALAGALRDAVHHRRCADYLCAKYGASFDDLRPSQWPADEGLVPHSTELADDFNRADESLDASGWTETAQDWSVVSSRARRINDNLAGDARYESDLSSDDHYGQCDFVSGPASSSRFGGPCCRFSSSARTYYSARQFRGASPFLRIAKVVSGSVTNLGSDPAISESLPDTVRIEASDSTIRIYFNGAQHETLTDTAISGNLRCGLCGQSSANSPVDLDNFAAADLAAAGEAPFLRRFLQPFAALFHPGMN